MAKIESAFASNNVASVQNAFDYAADLADDAFVSNTPEAYAKAADFSLMLFAFAEKWDFDLSPIDFSGAPTCELYERRAKAEAVAREDQERRRLNKVMFVGF
jgi:hypothetical protein